MDPKVIWTRLYTNRVTHFWLFRILPSSSYAIIEGIMKDKFPGLDEQKFSSMSLDEDQLTKAGQNLINGLNSGDIDGKWLESYGLDSNLLD